MSTLLVAAKAGAETTLATARAIRDFFIAFSSERKIKPVTVSSSAELSYTEMCQWTRSIIQTRHDQTSIAVVFSIMEKPKCCFVAHPVQTGLDALFNIARLALRPSGRARPAPP